MNTELIEQTWQALGDRRGQFVDAFYERFFERFPGYRRLFARKLQPADLEKMLFTAALLVDLADDREDIAPRACASSARRTSRSSARAGRCGSRCPGNTSSYTRAGCSRR